MFHRLNKLHCCLSFPNILMHLKFLINISIQKKFVFVFFLKIWFFVVVVIKKTIQIVLHQPNDDDLILKICVWIRSIFYICRNFFFFVVIFQIMLREKKTWTAVIAAKNKLSYFHVVATAEYWKWLQRAKKKLWISKGKTQFRSCV